MNIGLVTKRLKNVLLIDENRKSVEYFVNKFVEINNIKTDHLFSCTRSLGRVTNAT